MSTTNANKIGTHTVTVKGRLTGTSVTQTVTFKLKIDPCVVTSVKVISKFDSLDLTARSYTLSSSNKLVYTLDTKQTPDCGYSESNWSVSVSGGSVVSYFDHITTGTGIYSVGPLIDKSSVGNYVITINSVSVNGIIYGASTSQ